MSPARTPDIPLSGATPDIIPRERRSCTLRLGGREVRLTNLGKLYWPGDGYTKGDLLRYYTSVSEWLLPHLTERPMVMKRYPNGIEGKFFFMKRTPQHAPEWLDTCRIEHASGKVIDFPIVKDLASLLWLVNLGCIDLNPWYAGCDDIDRPDYLHFDLDPVPDAGFARVRKTALILRNTLDRLGMKSYPKTTGSKGIHVYVPILRGPTQKRVWTFAKAMARTLADRHPDLITAEYRVRARPADRILVDYNQNAWGRTLSSIYSTRPRPGAPVSVPVTWEEVEAGVEIDDFRMDNVPKRLRDIGDLWRPLTWPRRGRFDLERVL